jgi:hypothetical protein
VDAFCYTHPGRAPCIVMVDFVSLTTIVPCARPQCMPQVPHLHARSSAALVRCCALALRLTSAPSLRSCLAASPPALLSSYYKSMSLPRTLTPPATRACWRLPADKTLLEARGAFATYWDPVRDRPRESPTKRGGGGGGGAGGAHQARDGSASPRASPRGAPPSPRLLAAGAGGGERGPQAPPPLGLSSLAPASVTQGGGSAAAAAAAASAAAARAAQGGHAPPGGGAAAAAAAAATAMLAAQRVS